MLENKGAMRPSPNPSLLDLHFSLRCARRVNNDLMIAFEGQSYEIAPTKRKTVTIVHHPNQQFWVIEQPPKTVWPAILGAFSL